MLSRQQISAAFSRALLWVGFGMAALALSPAAEAQTTITKASTGTDLGASATWTPATTPSAADLGVFDSTWTSASTVTFSSALTIGEIKIVNPTNALTIQPGAAQTLNLGNSTFANGGGIDMLTSTVGVTFGTNVGVVLSNSQTWTVGNTTTNHPTLTVSGTINLGANALSLGGNGTTSLGGIISGTGGSITLLSGDANSGNLVVLSGANTYTGGTNLNGGTLAVNSATALGTAASRLTINGGTLDNTSGGAITMTNNNVQTWAGDFTFAGSNALSLGTGAVTMSGSRALTINASTLTVGGVISGSGFSLTKNGTGTLVLSSTASTYSGATVINGGTLSVSTLAAGGSNSGIGSSTAAASNLVLNGGTLQYTGATVSTNRLFTIGPNGATIDSSPATLANTLTLSNAGSIAFSSSTDPAILTLTGTGTGANTLTSILGDSGTGNNVTSLIKSGTGEWVLSGTNTYTGGTTLNTGTLALKSAAALGNGPLTINGGTLNNTSGGTLTLANNINQNWNAGFTFTGTNNMDMGTGSVVLGANIALVDSGSTLTIGGVISDGVSNFSITKSGAGTLVLNGANTFSGNLNISAGVLTLGSVNALQNATLDITAAAATVNLATGTNNIAGLVGVASGNITIGTNTLAINTQAGVTTTFTGNIITGTGGVTIGGSGTQVMAGSAGNYTGNTTLNSGTLKINSAAAIGTGNLTINGGSLDSSGIAMTTNNAQKWNGDFTFIGSGTLNVGTGAVAMNASRTVTVSASTLTVGGIISGSTFGLTKNGTGTMVLTGQSGVSTYNGSTTVNAGTLTLDFTSASSATGIVNSTSALSLNGGTLSLLGKSATSDAQTFSGTTIGAGASTVTLTSGSTGTMNVTLGGITRDAGATVNFVNPTSGCIGINGTIVTTGGVYTSGNTAFATVAGTDFATISSNHVIAATSVLGTTVSGWTSGTNEVVSGATTGTLGATLAINALKTNGTVAEAINLGSHTLTVTTGGIVMSGSATPTISNGTIKGSNTGELVVVQNSTGTATISANIVNNTGATGLTKSGTGNLLLSGANTYSGNTYINSGTLEVASNTALGANGTTTNVASGATLKIDNGIAIGGDNSNTALGTVSGSLLNLSGTGVGGLGALIAGGATGDWVGNIALTSNATVSSGATASAVLTLGSNATGTLTSNINLGSNTLTLAGPTSTATDEITSNITGTGNVIVDTAGTAHYLMDGNGYTGNTFVNNGTLILDTTSQGNVSLKTSGNLLAIRGDLTIGDGTGSGNTAIVQFGSGATPDARNVMGSDGNITVKSDGKLYLNGQTQVIQDLTVNGGFINTANGTNLGLLTINGNTTIQANAATVFFDGNVGLGNSVGGAVNTINVNAGGNVTSDLTVNALLNGGGFIKTGNGTMTLTNNSSTFTNTVEVSSGTLVVAAGNQVLGATSNGTTVDTGAQLQLKPTSDITDMTAEPLTVNGNGTANNGALQNVQGNNTWTGPVSTGANNATINTSGGNLTLSGNVGVVSGTPTLTFTGSNTTTLSGNVNGAQNIVINSASTNKVIMSGTLANTYSGTTTVNSGATLVLNKTANTASVSGSTITVNSGGTLLSNTSEQISAGTAMVLNGGSWTTNGAATANWAENLGTLTLSNNSTINLGTGNNTIAFQASNSQTWTPGSSLYLNNWNGNLSGAGTDQVKFALSNGLSGTSSSGQLGDIIFVNPVVDGSSFSGNYHAIILSTGEVVPFLPAPEPGTVVAGASLAILAGLREWRRRMKKNPASVG